MPENTIVHATNSPGGTATYRIFMAVVGSATAVIAGAVLTYMIGLNKDIIDMRIDRATIVGQVNSMQTQITTMRGDISDTAKQLGVFNGRIIVLEQNVKVK